MATQAYNDFTSFASRYPELLLACRAAGLTATPKRDDKVDNYAYFGEPVLTYSLKDGINDGYLTPFRLRHIATTLGDYVYTPDDLLIEGEIEAGRRYEEANFNRVIEISQRQAYRVKLLMQQIDPREKRLCFARRKRMLDVFAHVAYALAPRTREERAAQAMALTRTLFNSKQQVFLDFVLSHYVTVGVQELDVTQLTPLLRLKYRDSIADASADLGKAEEISRAFSGFPKYLYQPTAQ